MATMASPALGMTRAIQMARIVVTLLFALAGVKLYTIQILEHEHHAAMARDLYSRDRVLAAERGRIVDCRGRTLAEDKPTVTVYVRPSALTDPQATAHELAGALGRDAGQLAGEMREAQGTTLPVARDREVAVLERMAATLKRESAAIAIERAPRRSYPEGSVAADLLGFVDASGVGKAGLEQTFEHRLHGQSGLEERVVDVFGRSLEHRTRLEREPADGDTLVLALDATLQAACERKLAEAVKSCQAQAGYALVMHVPTGRVRAACDYPSYDLTKARRDSDAELWRAGFASWTHEPGSTMKPLTFAMAIEAGVITPNQTFYCDGSEKVADRTIKCHSPDGGHGTLDVAGVLAVSCNDATAQVGRKAAAARMCSLFTSLGFTQNPTDELSSAHMPLQTDGGAPWAAIAAFGQGVSITPLHLTAAYAALANDGVLLRPEFVEATIGPDGERHERELAPGRRVFDPATARLIVRDLIQTVESKQGTGTAAAIPGVRIAGKTGTAQIASSTGGYRSDRFVVSFVGILPADKPQWVVTVVLDSPADGNAWGGTMAAPAFREIARSLCSVEGIPMASTGKDGKA